MLFSGLLSAVSATIPLEIVHISDVFDIRDTALLDGVQENFQNDVLYIGYYRQSLSGVLPAHCILVRPEGALPSADTSGDLALTDEKSLFFLFNRLKSLVDASRGSGLYAQLMDSAAQTKSLMPLANLAASKLGNSVILLDSDFKVLACSTVYPIDDPLWTQNIRQGYCSYEFISAVGEMDSIKNAPRTPEAIAVTCYASPLRKLSSKIFHNGQLIGFVIMLENESALSPEHFEMLPAVSAAAGDAIGRFAPYLLPDSTHYQRLLYALLIGTPPEKLAIHIAKLSFPETMCALRLSQPAGQGLKYLKEQAAQRLKALAPGAQLTLHENGLAALLPLGGRADIPPETLFELEAFAKSEGLFIGVSSAFSRIEDFAPRYEQACRALELDRLLKRENRVCRHLSYAFYDLLSSAGEPEKLRAFCHPALRLLEKYDTENGTELYRTLETFLACGCNIKLAAEKLFIHRNSLTYRLRRISELTGVDPEESATRFLLEMSFKIDRFVGEDPVRASAGVARR